MNDKNVHKNSTIKILLCTALILAGIAFLHPQIAGSLEWTDPTLSPSSPIRAVHFTELRSQVNNQRFLCGLGAYSFTDSIVSKTTPIRKLHLDEIKESIEQISTNGSVSRTPPAMPSIGVISAGSTVISLNHISDLRGALSNTTCCGDGICQAADETTANCPGDCLCTYSPSYGTTCGEMGCPGGSVLITQTAIEGEILCPNKYSCENKPSLCCSYFLSAAGCGDGIHCGETQSMTEKVGQGCVVPDNEKYLCGADESCCTYDTTDLGCGAIVDGFPYPFYTRVYQSVDTTHPQCVDKIVTVDNEADCCDYKYADGCGTTLVDSDTNVHNSCDGTTYDEGTWVECTWSDTFPIDCAPTIVSDENSANCCTYTEISTCIDKFDPIVPITYVAVTKQTVSEDAANPDCDQIVTEEEFHDDCCGYNTTRDECESSTNWVQYTDADNTDCPSKSVTKNTSIDDINNLCCSYEDPVVTCGGQCNGRGLAYPLGTKVICTSAGNLNCNDIVTTSPNDDDCCGFDTETGCGGKFDTLEAACGGDGTYSMSDLITCKVSATMRGAGCDDVITDQEVDSDTCCQYSTGGLGCGADCNGTVYPADTKVTSCEISSTGFCPEVIGTEENHDDCCQFVTDTAWQCGGTCGSQTFAPNEAYKCTNPTINVALCADGITAIIADTATSTTECCNYTTTSGCGLTCEGNLHTAIESVTCQISTVTGCPTIETATSTLACCGYTNIQGCNLECNNINYGANEWIDCNEVTPDSMKAFGCTDQLDTGSPVTNASTCCNYVSNTGWGLTCGGTSYPAYYWVTCQTSAVADCDDIIDNATDKTDTYCGYIYNSGYAQTCDGITYGTEEYTECKKKTIGAPGDADPYCDDVLVNGPTFNGDGTYCQYSEVDSYAGCGVNCDGTDYPISDYVICKTSLTGNPGCDAPTVTRLDTDDPSCCVSAEYTTTQGCGIDCGNVTTYADTDLITCTSIPSKPSCPVTVNKDIGSETCCTDYMTTEGCGVSCDGGTTFYDDHKYVTCYDSPTAGCDKTPVIASNSADLCCNFQTNESCGLSCESTSYDDTTLVKCQTSTLSGCTASTLISSVPYDVSCCNWSDWENYGGGTGCGMSLTVPDIARLAAGPTSCSVIQNLQARIPTNPNCLITTRCENDCGKCIYAADASNPYQSCDYSPSCLGRGTQYCASTNDWGACEQSLCFPLTTLACDYLPIPGDDSDPYIQHDYKICDPCGDQYGACSCGHHPLNNTLDSFACLDAYAPCPTDFDTNYYSCDNGKLKINGELAPIDNCPGIRNCVDHEWSSTCTFQKTFGTPLSYKGSCTIEAPDGSKHTGAYRINECGTDYFLDGSNNPICYCQGDIAGICQPFDDCKDKDGVFKCQPDGTLGTCEAISEGKYSWCGKWLARGEEGTTGQCDTLCTMLLSNKSKTYNRCGRMEDCN